MADNQKLSEFFQIYKKTNPLLSAREAANYLGITEQTLATWRCNKRYGIPYVKVGRLVKYRQSSLDTFLDNQTMGEVEA